MVEMLQKSTYLQVDTISILRKNDFDTFLSGKDLGTSSRKFGLVEILDSPYFLGLWKRDKSVA